jgi:hypothetical protein
MNSPSAAMGLGYFTPGVDHHPENWIPSGKHTKNYRKAPFFNG